MGYCSVIARNDVLAHGAKRMDPEDVVLSEMSQSQKGQIV